MKERTRLIVTYVRVLTAAFVVAAVLAIASLYAWSDRTSPVVKMSKGIVAAAAAAPAVLPEGATLSGSYLAGRFAQRQQDWDAAQKYINTVIGFDQDNKSLEQRAFLLSLGAGQYSRAKRLAEKIAGLSDGNDLAAIYLSCEAMSRGDYKTAISFAEKLPADGFGQYTKPLLTAWSYVGLGRHEEAVSLLASSASPGDPTYNFHIGLIEEIRGDTKAALVRFETAAQNGLTLHAAVLSAQFFEKNARKDLAEKIYARLGSSYPLNPFVAGLKTKEMPSLSEVTPAQGAGIALFDLASLLYERRSYDSAQVYGSLVRMLMPKSDFVMMMLGDIAVLNEKYDRAVESYDAIESSSPLFWMARMRVAEVYQSLGTPERAEVLLKELSSDAETRLPAFAALGDLYRGQEKYAEAIQAYDRALSEVDEKKPQYWGILYARGMSREKMNDWNSAEKDLMVALESQPDNAMILNFIGYSWAEKGINLDRALEFTRRAAELKPEDGFILDSYGWALYRKGNFSEAVKVMERAVAQLPDEAVMLDHLGDAYWQVGRRNEAKFKWNHANDISKDAKLKAEVQKKIKVGLETPATLAVHLDGVIPSSQ